MKKLFFVFACLTLAFGSNAAHKLEVVATLPDFGAVAAEVGGSFINLNTLANPAEDAHFVDPRPSFARLLNKADLLIEGGADLEAGWLPPLIQNARNGKILPGQPGRFVAAEGLELKERPTGPIDRSQGDVHTAGNPHFMMDPENAIILAQRLSQRFAESDPEHAAQFSANAKKFADDVKKELPEILKLLEPLKGQKVITYHRSFTYFLDRFGLELFDTIEPKPGIEPSPAHIGGLIQRAKAANIKLILIEENRPKKTPERIARDLGAKVVVLHHFPQPRAGQYLPWIRGMVEAIQKSSP